MGIYRGPGGSGDATADTSNNSITAVAAANAAEASKIAAAASAASAATSATTATTQAGLASTSATNAETSEDAAAVSATNSALSASSASTQATNAAASATTATTQATNATSSASSASTSAATATTQATNASSSASSASTSATSASGSASTATTQAGIATTKASEASTSASNAATSASTATTQATNAASSATSASGSATTATTQATNASTYASNANTSASNAATSESNAATSASSASTSATAAQTAKTAAEAAQTAAESVYDSFDDRYLGAKATAPTTDNDGGTLLVGALYFDTVSTIMKIWTGSVWLSAFASLSGALIAANNLSDLTNTATARTSLGLGSLATQDSDDINITGGNITNVDLIDTISLDVSGDVQIDGNLTVGGTVTTVNTATLAVDDNLIYLNDGSLVANPDLGIAGNYNDGTYKHAGFFRDATDGKWKFFHNYTPEPDASPYIDITHASFALSDIQANRLWGNVTGNITGNADTATNVAYTGLTGTVPTWNQNTTGTAAGLSTILDVSSGGTGTATPSLVAGSNITITGTFPNQTITGSAAGVTSVSATSPLDSTGGFTPTISIPQATTSVSGYLTATDWNTFNNKWTNGTALSATTGTFSGALDALSVTSGGNPVVTNNGGLYDINVYGVRVAISETNSNFKVPFTNTTAIIAGNYGLRMESENTFTYNPSTNTLTVANLEGNASTATLASSATVALSATSATNATTAASCTGNAATATALASATGSAPSYAVRAFVNFNGTGAVSIRQSINVSSISDLGVGRYIINLTTAMPTSTYTCVGSCGSPPGRGQAAFMVNEVGGVATASTTSSQPIYTYHDAGGAADSQYVQSMIIG